MPNNSRKKRRNIRLRLVKKAPFRRGPGRLFYLKDYRSGAASLPGTLSIVNTGSPSDWAEMMRTSGRQQVNPQVKEHLDQLHYRAME